MDTQKDNNLSRFIDTDNVRTNPFGDNQSGDRAYKRAERIVAALYLITNHVKNEEPLRSMVRGAAANMLSEVLALKDEMRAPSSQSVIDVQVSVRKLISWVKLLSVSGYVSIQNAEVVIEALDELGNFLQASQRTTLSETFSLTRDNLIGPAYMATKKMQRSQLRSDARASMSERVKDNNASDIKDGKDSTDTSVRTNSSQTYMISSRSVAILDVLKKGVFLGIADIASNLPEYSEKMIQRELADLVARGQVQKTGLKRWSRYTRA